MLGWKSTNGNWQMDAYEVVLADSFLVGVSTNVDWVCIFLGFHS